MNPLRALFIVIALAAIGGVAYFMTTTSSAPDDSVAQHGKQDAGKTESNAPLDAPKIENGADKAEPEAAQTPTRAAAESAPNATGPKEAASRATCRVVGRVVDDGGAPLAGIPVSIATINGLVIIDEKGDRQAPRDKGTKSGPDGRFALEGVHAGFGTSVRVEPDKLVIAEKPVPKQDGGVIDLGDFVCATGGTLVGRVVNEAGNPIAGANVEAWTVEKGKGSAGLFMIGDGGQQKSRKTVSDGSGNFRIDGLAPGEAALSVAAEGHTREFKKGVEVKRAEISPEVLVALSSGASIEGVVLDSAGHAIPDAKVRIMETVLDLTEGGLSNQVQQSREVAADASGNFKLTGLKDSAYHVVGRAPGYLPVTKESVASGSKDVRITLERSGIVYGYVRSSKDKKPVEKFSVRLENVGFGGPVFIPIRDSQTEAVYGVEAAKLVGVAESAGLYAFTALPSEGIRLNFEADGFASGAGTELTVKGNSKVQQDVELQPEIRLSGIVLGSDGKGVEGAQVVLSKHSDEAADTGGGARVFTRRARLAGPSRAAPALAFGDGEEPVTTSGPDGKFTLKGLHAGDFDLVANHPNWAPADRMPVTLKDGDDLEGVKLELKEAGVLIGVAYDADGKPFANGIVSVNPKRQGGDGNSISAIGGAFADTSLPGLPGSPLVATSGADGKFRIGGIPPGQYLATLKAPQKASGGTAVFMSVNGGPEQKGKPVAIEAGQETEQDLFLTPTGKVAGTVTEAGKPIANVIVSLKEKGSFMPMDIGNGKTDDRGHYEIADVEPGEYTLSVKPAGAAIPVVKKVGIRPRETVDADIGMPTGGMSGKVRDRDSSKGLPNVTVEVRKHRAKSGGDDAPQEARSVGIVMISAGGGGGGMQTMKFGDEEDSVKTDAEGNYVVRFLEPGDYDVEIKGAGISPDKRESVSVAEGKVVPNVNFDAIRGASLIITAKPANDEPLQFVTLEIHPTDKPDEQRREASGGNSITVDGLKPGEYTLTVSSGQFEGTATVTLASGEKKPIEVPLH